jgi:hypothetical protein
MDRLIFIGIILFVLFGSAAAIYLDNKEKDEWKIFSLVHDCEVVAKKRGTSTLSPIIGSGGNVSFVSQTTPAQTAWSCNDGITYWR